MRRCYDRHGVPASLRAHLDDPTDPADYDERDEELGDDGREIARLYPANIFNRSTRRGRSLTTAGHNDAAMGAPDHTAQ